ncbi:MAG: hypothetical protein WA632_14180, partial [Gallionella sp.]
SFNQDAPAQGYYSWIDPALALNSAASWADAKSMPVGTDSGDNEVRYIIQRMCRNQNMPAIPSNCMFTSATVDTSGRSTPLTSDQCHTGGCQQAGQSPQYRITSRITGPTFTVSYIQAIVN